jgi:hypothetical protein
MLDLYYKLCYVLRTLAGLVIPLFARARFYRGAGAAFRWVLHLVIFVAVLVGLCYLNRPVVSDLYKLVDSPYRVLREGWLPILFLLVYALAWLGWWLWRLLLPGEDESAFPDIDKAWEEATDALRQKGLGVSDAPLFLILGRPAASEEALLRASRLALEVNPAPARKDAPLHVYANRDGIYVTCSRTSLLGRQAALLAGEVGSTDGAAANQDALGQSIDIDKTVRPNEGPRAVREIQAILERARKQGRSYDQLTADERQQIARLERQDRPRPSLLQDAAQTDLLTARFEHLCRLIVRDRRPYCAANGILLLLPLAATDSDDAAGQTGDVCRRDLSTVRRVFGLHCPLLALVCDLETATGFAEFIGHFSDKQRQQRLGQRFPHVPDLPPEELPRAVEDMAAWLCQSVMPAWVYKYLRVEAPGKDEREAVVRANGLLFRFFNDMWERRQRLGRLLTRALLLDASGPLLFGGCYLAGTGSDPAREQAFVPGVFSRLLKEQNLLLWTDEALAEDAFGRRWAAWGYALLALVVAGIVGGAAAYHFLGRPKGR